MRKHIAFIILAILITVSVCACSDKQEETVYNGPYLTDLLSYKTPEKMTANTATLASQDESSVLEIDFREDSAMLPCATLSLVIGGGIPSPLYNQSCAGKGIDWFIEKSDVIDTIKIDGEKGYVTRVHGYDLNNKSGELTEIYFEHNNSIFELGSEELTTAGKDNYLYEIAKTIKFK